MGSTDAAAQSGPTVLVCSGLLQTLKPFVFPNTFRIIAVTSLWQHLQLSVVFFVLFLKAMVKSLTASFFSFVLSREVINFTEGLFSSFPRLLMNEGIASKTGFFPTRFRTALSKLCGCRELPFPDPQHPHPLAMPPLQLISTVLFRTTVSHLEAFIILSSSLLNTG